MRQAIQTWLGNLLQPSSTASCSTQHGQAQFQIWAHALQMICKLSRCTSAHVSLLLCPMRGGKEAHTYTAPCKACADREWPRPWERSTERKPTRRTGDQKSEGPGTRPPSIPWGHLTLIKKFCKKKKRKEKEKKTPRAEGAQAKQCGKNLRGESHSRQQ